MAVTANLVGQADGRAAYVTQAAQMGLSSQLAFHDPMPAREAFSTARVLVVPSRAESLPYVVLEAVAGTMPVIATNVGGIPEIFGPYSPDLVPADDANALAEKIQSMLADPDAALGDALARRDWARGRFSVAAMEAEIAAVYRDALPL
jgi:glycosyltransferase involved in cell wall biosynthesis